MRDRVALVGGRLEVSTGAPGTGTVLRVTLPLPVSPSEPRPHALATALPGGSR